MVKGKETSLITLDLSQMPTPENKTKKHLDLTAQMLGFYGAGNEIRTRDVNLGKVALYH